MNMISGRVFGMLLLLLPWHAICADVWPQRPLRLIVPFPPGGATDNVMRVVAQKLGEAIGQQVLVDNRPGGGTIIGTEMAARAAPDGYTLLVVTAAFTTNPGLVRKLPYDTEKDFAPVSLVSSAPNLLVVNPALPVSSVGELIALAKAKPRSVNYGSAGNGTSNHLAGELFRGVAGVDIVHVPYKGDAPAIIDLISGQIQMMFIGLGPVAQHIKGGRLKALAVSSAAPFQITPDLPTVASAGLRNFESAVWNGIVVPAATPADIINRLQGEIARVLAQPDSRDKVLALGFEPVGNNPAQFREFIAAETRRTAKVVSDAGLRAE